MERPMDTATVLWAIGIVVSVLLVFLGTKVVRKRSQSARAGDNSNVVQSGRDSTIQ